MKNEKLGNFAEDGIQMEDLDLNVFVIRVLELNVVAGVLAEEHLVADFEELSRVGAVFAHAALSDSEHSAFRRFLFGCGIGNYNAGGGDFLLRKGEHNHAVTEWFDLHCELGSVCHWKGE